ncbi:MAG: hypothetical protein IT578_04220 [Verrucomicrobiae bacterium]|nr:hypothetical protein [Verrucomicrobiae bacterium]
MSFPIRIEIKVREYGGTYIARAAGWNCTASCTANDDLAAEACAVKLLKRQRGWKGARWQIVYVGPAWQLRVWPKGEPPSDPYAP